MSKRQKKDLVKELAEEIDVFDHMLSALVEVLEEKGIMTQEEWEERIRSKLDKKLRSLSYRDVEP